MQRRNPRPHANKDKTRSYGDERVEDIFHYNQYFRAVLATGPHSERSRQGMAVLFTERRNP